MDRRSFRIAFKSEFNSPAKVLALWAMENSISPGAVCQWILYNSIAC